MKTKIALLLCISTLVITVSGCGNQADMAEGDMTNTATIFASDMTKAALQKAVDAANEAIKAAKSNNAEAGEQISLSWDEFRDKVLDDCDYDISEEELQVLYQEIRDSKILKGENSQLTGLALNDYDQNGQTDMTVCALTKGHGYLYLFMNGKKIYHLYDLACYSESVDIFSNFGADIDHDQNIEVVLCVGRAENDSVKCIIKLMDKGVKRMEIPSYIEVIRGYGFLIRHDYGQDIRVKKGMEREVYRVYYSYQCDEEVELKLEGQEEPEELVTNKHGGYYKLGLTEYQGEELLTGYEYIYFGDTVVGSAVFVFDWDENGEAYVKAWYVEDNDGKKHVPLGKIKKSAFDYTHIFDENETGEEVKAYEEFITGKMTAHIDDNICTDTSRIGITATDPEVMDKDGQGFYFEDLIDEIIKETMDYWGNGIRNVQYALIDCGNDGKKQLALRAYDLGIEGTHDDSTCTMVFDYKDGKIFMVYVVDAWSRSRTDLYKNGYVYGEGSAGASCNYAWERFIGADGVYRADCHTEYGDNLPEMSSWFGWEGNDKIINSVYFSKYSINGETVYSYNTWDDADITDKDRQVISDYIQHNESLMGVNFLTGDEMKELLAENRKSLGITEGMDGEENKIDWRVLPRLTALSQ